jgi:methionyl aminopeptidase
MRETVQIKTADEIARIRAASLIVHDVLDEVVAAVAAGVTTAELDRVAARGAARRGAAPAFLGYHGYPATICISINDEVVHGIPSERRVLREGDVVGLDFGVSYQGFFGDAARTVPVGTVSPEAARLLATTAEALRRAIDAARPDGRLGDIGFAV